MEGQAGKSKCNNRKNRGTKSKSKTEKKHVSKTTFNRQKQRETKQSGNSWCC